MEYGGNQKDSHHTPFKIQMHGLGGSCKPAFNKRHGMCGSSVMETDFLFV